MFSPQFRDASLTGPAATDSRSTEISSTRSDLPSPPIRLSRQRVLLLVILCPPSADPPIPSASRRRFLVKVSLLPSTVRQD